jgi:hypothetical protein
MAADTSPVSKFLFTSFMTARKYQKTPGFAMQISTTALSSPAAIDRQARTLSSHFRVETQPVL